MRPPQEVYDELVPFYDKETINRPEREFLSRIDNALPEWSILDLGVGAGRTTHFLSPRAKSYFGVDFAPAMIEQCRRRFPESERIRFLCADAANLNVLGDKTFDLILFSHCGIDTVGHEKRKLILHEVAKRLRPAGQFFFSTHSLEAFPYPFHFRPNRQLPSKVYWHLRMRWENRKIDWAEVKARGWAVAHDGAHGFRLRHHFTTLAHQYQELAEVGLRVDTVWTDAGKVVPETSASAARFLTFLCHKKDGLA